MYDISHEQMLDIAGVIAEIKGMRMEVQTRCEEVDLSHLGIHHGKCIDDDLISRTSAG